MFRIRRRVSSCLLGLTGSGVSVGECGELVWRSVERTLHATGIDGEPREVAEEGRALWFEGNRILYAEGPEQKLAAGDGEVLSWPIDGVSRAGALPGAFWLSYQRGIERLDDEGVELLISDMATSAFGSLCHTIAVSRTPKPPSPCHTQIRGLASWAPKRGQGGEHVALLERERWEGEVRTEELVAIDGATGEEEVLVRGRFVGAWYLDHSDRPVVALVSPQQRDARQESWSGVAW